MYYIYLLLHPLSSTIYVIISYKSVAISFCRVIVRLTNDIATCSSRRYIVCVAISFCRGIVRLPGDGGPVRHF